MAKKVSARGKQKEKKNIAQGIAHIKSTFNNTVVAIADAKGDVISWASAGTVGFKGSRKGTPFAAQLAAESAARKAMEHGLKRVDVYVKGPVELRCGDYRDVLADVEPDAVITDPPYGARTHTGQRTAGRDRRWVLSRNRRQDCFRCSTFSQKALMARGIFGRSSSISKEGSVVPLAGRAKSITY